ncbi:MAG: hypothetical protein PHH30_04065 [Bacteroidales bacterium]|nr:hypothetical protein [Bacteroidales bacterium]
MKKLVYNTAHGQLTISKNDSVVLEFQNLYMVLNLEKFFEFVEFVNQNIDQLSGTIIEKPKDSFYHIVLRNMDEDLAEEFKKLINVPVFSPDSKYDVFDYLKEMKNNQTGIFTDKVSGGVVKLDSEAICLN